VAAADRTTGVLVRVGADTTCGGANSPIRLATGEYVYVPIPERPEHARNGFRREYAEVAHRVRAFVGSDDIDRWLPRDRYMHLDPDFDALTYGDSVSWRGERIAALAPGDFIAFYASFRPVDCAGWLVYALIGLLTVERIVRAADLRASDRHLSAHARRAAISPHDVVVFGTADTSGRFERAIPIGEFRGCAYRVQRDLLEAWGGLSVADGYLQPSAMPPLFRAPQRFLGWLRDRDPRLVRANWAAAASDRPARNSLIEAPIGRSPYGRTIRRCDAP
jgi:Nucleotide modification associated domain 3